MRSRDGEKQKQRQDVERGEEGGETVCTVCTLIQSNSVADCELCGAPLKDSKHSEPASKRRKE